MMRGEVAVVLISLQGYINQKIPDKEYNSTPWTTWMITKQNDVNEKSDF